MRRHPTRRELIVAAATLVGGSGAGYAAARGLGLVGAEPAPPLEGRVDGTRVLILGAGLAGMAAAYELAKLGYDCRLLEARDRAGGRCWTVRGGSELVEVDGSRQVAAFDDPLYFNPGPARISHHHTATLDYCRELGVAVELFANANEAAYFYHEGEGPLANRRVRIREVRADLHGYLSEMLVKALGNGVLDGVDRVGGQALRRLLFGYGDLGSDGRYRGSPRRGAGVGPGALDEPHALDALLDAALGDFLAHERDYDQQMTMFQIVGGTDRLAAAFVTRVGDRIEYGAEVREIRHRPDGVRVVFRDHDGETRVEEAPYCICTIPLSVLRDIRTDFATAMRRAIAAVDYVPTGKTGLQFSRRFWEEDDQIFGGISRTNMGITRVWYPSTGFLSEKGILIGSYDIGPGAIASGAMAPEARIEWAIEQGRRIHPQYDETFEHGFSVPWHRVPYSLGGWAHYTPATRESAFPTLGQPDGEIFLAGEHVSYLNGWMAGAFESARRAVGQLHERALARG